MLYIVKTVINNNIKKNSNFCFIQHLYITYLFGISGEIKIDSCTEFKDFFILIRKNYIDKKKENKIIIYKFDKYLTIDNEDQLLIIHKNFYKHLGIPSFNKCNINSLLINNLFESIKITKKPIYTLLSLVNFLGSDICRNKKDDIFEKIKHTIKINSYNANFNLEELCSIIFMSKRKVQYIISSNNTTYLKLLHQYRIENLKNLIMENKNISILKMSYISGFANYSTANRLFKNYVGISIKDYINEWKYLN
ncbi:helix-turn-helix domain-containing protein [Aliivibrio fischeri]|uniref:Helix-turn-helix domain-containing protein n=1 Tax=Aliivibrio fischeri TaxID=668 RepID=A0A510UN30_ALIFS|nr:helix-turn-helix domain-containing protein [Aliivibrio fischeri]MUK51187.1 helix-turn-helix domain-containing protein [Aliivibrio fischeri]GEK16083.1 hypothetical protein AFI02nite_41190 [Aliivibrio fischeri]